MPRTRERLCKVCGIAINDLVNLSKRAETCGEIHSAIYRHRKPVYDQRELVLVAFRRELEDLRLRILQGARVAGGASYTLTMFDKGGVPRRWPPLGKGRRKLSGGMTTDRNFGLSPFEYPVVRRPGEYEVHFYSQHDARIQLDCEHLIIYVPYGIFTLDEVKPLDTRDDRTLPPTIPLEQLFPVARENSSPTAIEEAWVNDSAKLPENGTD